MVGLVSYILQKLMNESVGSALGELLIYRLPTAIGRGLASHQDFTLGNGCGIF